MEPEVVATSPYRIKSPVPVLLWLRLREIGARGQTCTDTRDALDVVPLRWATRAKWILQPVLPRPGFFTKEARRLLHGGKMVAVSGAAPDAAGL